MNLLTLLGFVAMGLGLTLRRMANASLLVLDGRLNVGTALILLGLYLKGSSF
jgi:hypothetical protein